MSAWVPARCFFNVLLFQLVDFVADSFHVVKTIEERLDVDAHPREKGLDFLILVEDEPCVDDGLLQEEADGFVVGDTVAKSVNLVKFVENVRVVVLHLRRGTGFVGKLQDGSNAANLFEFLHKRAVTLGHQHIVFVLHGQQWGCIHTKGGLHHHGQFGAE